MVWEGLIILTAFEFVGNPCRESWVTPKMEVTIMETPIWCCAFDSCRAHGFVRWLPHVLSPSAATPYDTCPHFSPE